MIGQWFRVRKERKDTARALYYAAAMQARQPAFYQEMAVPDTVDGRFEMVCLHVFMLMHTLRQTHGRDTEKLAQALFDRMFKVTDQTMRQAGIGDLSVPRHMKRMMTAFNGRAHAYTIALREGAGMEDTLRRNVYGTVENVSPDAVTALNDYVMYSLQALDAGAIMQGRTDFSSLYTPQEQRRHG